MAYIIQGSHSGCGTPEIPGVSQVEKDDTGKKSQVVSIIEAEKSAGVIHFEKGR